MHNIKNIVENVNKLSNTYLSPLRKFCCAIIHWDVLHGHQFWAEKSQLEELFENYPSLIPEYLDIHGKACTDNELVGLDPRIRRSATEAGYPADYFHVPSDDDEEGDEV